MANQQIITTWHSYNSTDSKIMKHVLKMKLGANKPLMMNCQRNDRDKCQYCYFKIICLITDHSKYKNFDSLRTLNIKNIWKKKNPAIKMDFRVSVTKLHKKR